MSEVSPGTPTIVVPCAQSNQTALFNALVDHHPLVVSAFVKLEFQDAVLCLRQILKDMTAADVDDACDRACGSLVSVLGLSHDETISTGALSQEDTAAFERICAAATMPETLASRASAHPPGGGSSGV